MSLFAQRHYQTMARWLAAQHHTCCLATGKDDLWQELVGRACDWFAADNPKFKRALFVRACQPEYQVTRDLVG